MSLTLTILDRAPSKPKEAEPCNGCGVCCAAEVCAIGVAVLGTGKTPCPAMEFDDGRFWCGLVLHPEQYAKVPKRAGRTLGLLHSHLLGIGRGCDSDAPEGMTCFDADMDGQIKA